MTIQSAAHAERVAELQELAGKCINTSDSTVSFEISTMAGAQARKYRLAPLEQVDIAPGYAVRFQHAEGRTIRPSIVEQLTNGAVVPLIYPEGRAALERAVSKQQQEKKKA